MLSRSALIARPAARAAFASPLPIARPFSSTPLRSTTHPAHGGSSGQAASEDMADTAGKNIAVPFFMAAGVGAVGYLIYMNFYSGKEARQEKANAPKNQEKENPPAGSKPLTGMRG
ncbi:hypothetical protein JCM11251_006979 [Rhodosporidiobolus azoricus]